MAQHLLVGGTQAEGRLTTVAGTIYALSSGALPSGIAVVRVSGPGALVALQVIAGPLPAPRTATLRTLHDGEIVIDRALVLAFPAPASATGEDVAEFHVHGGPAVVAALLAALAQQPGLRPAAAGEFTRRAFHNGRMDLTQAEGLADLVAAETEGQRRAALVTAGGALRVQVEAWRETVLDRLAEAEAALDFSDEEDVVSTAPSEGVAALAAAMTAAATDADRAKALRDGLTIVVAGPPNAGKSSLVNALAMRDVAIVSPHPGTTRDAIEVRLDLGGVLVTLVDTAGLREASDPVEAEGIDRARARAANADLVLSLYAEGPVPVDGVPVRTKIDLAHHDGGGLGVSVVSGAGLDALTRWLADWARDAARPDEPPLITQERQRLAIAAAAAALHEAATEGDAVLQAESLRTAAASLGSVTGAVGVEDVLDRIFGRFCIGK